MLNLSHSKNGKLSVKLGRLATYHLLDPTGSLIVHEFRAPQSYFSFQNIHRRQSHLAAEDEPLKAPSCPQSEEAAAVFWICLAAMAKTPS